MEKNAKSSDEKNYRMFELQMMQGQMESLRQQKMQLEAKRIEMKSTINALESIGASEEKDVMVPLGSGVFVNASLKGNKSAVYFAGAETAIGKPIPEVVKFVQEQGRMANEAEAELDQQMKQLAERANKVIAELEATEGKE